MSGDCCINVIVGVRRKRDCCYGGIDIRYTAGNSPNTCTTAITAGRIAKCARGYSACSYISQS